MNEPIPDPRSEESWPTEPGYEAGQATYAITTTRSPRRYFVWGLRLAAVMVLVGAAVVWYPTYMGWVTSDIAPIDDRDLVPAARMVPESENAYFDLLALSQAMETSGLDWNEVKEMASGTEMWDSARARKMLASAKPVLGAVARFAAKPSFQDPAWANPADITLEAMPSSLTPLRATDLVLIDLRLALEEGRVNDARSAAVRVRHSTELLLQPNHDTIQHLVALRILSRLHRTLTRALPTLPAQDALALVAAYEAAATTKLDASMVNAFQIEYVQIRAAFGDFEGLAAEIGPMPGAERKEDYERIAQGETYWYRPNKTIARFADLARTHVQSAKAGCHGEVTEILPAEVNVPSLTGRRILLLRFRENAMGDILYAVSAAGLGQTIERTCATDAYELLLATARALVAHAVLYGAYPDSLDALVGQELTELPTDPFSHTPLRYDAARRMLYSVGQNRTDDGGDSADERDLVVTLPALTPDTTAR